MDFLQLLQKANSNQATARKKHERERAKKEQERHVQKTREEQLKKEAAVRLREVTEEDHHRKIRYKGTVPLPADKGRTHPPVLPSPVHMASSPPATTSQPTKKASSSSKTASSKTASKSDKTLPSKAPSGKTPSDKPSKSGKSSSSKSTITKPKSGIIQNGQQLSGNGRSASESRTSGSKKAITASGVPHNLLSAQRAGSGQVKGKGVKAKSVSPFRGGGGDGNKKMGGAVRDKAAGAKRETPGKHTEGRGGCPKQGKSANFQDLIKMAAQNSSVGVRDGVSGGKGKDAAATSSPSSRDQSPVGKSLLDRVSHRGKGKSLSRDNSPLGKSLLDRGNRMTPSKPAPPTKTEASHVVRDPHAPGGRSHGREGTPRQKDGGHLGGGVGSSGVRDREGSKAVLTRRPLRTPPPNKAGRKGDPLPDVRGRSSRPPVKSAGAASFYGAAASNILRQGAKSRPFAGSGGKYTSTWVDEMSQYVRSELIEEDEDDYSDLEGFVASDDEFLDDGEEGVANDYSSEIRRLFRYDPTKFADGGFDDGAMESSFAQQEFEEIRSGRIGHMEDEQELARERATLKRKKQTKHKPSKQSKLSF